MHTTVTPRSIIRCLSQQPPYDMLLISENEVRGQHLPGVTCFSCSSRDRLLLFDGRGLEDRQRAEAAPGGGHQWRPQRGFSVGARPRMTVCKTTIQRIQLKLITEPCPSVCRRPESGGGLTFSDRREDVQTGPTNDRLPLPFPGQHLQTGD